jgi:predicted nucleic acid-binding protein
MTLVHECSRRSRARDGGCLGRELDIAIAACAVVQESHLWTLNQPDFKDIPGLKLC